MDEDIVKQIFDELLSSFEPLETKTAALLNLLKAKGIANDEELAPFLEQAGNVSNVRWRAMRVRIDALISAMKPPEHSAEASSTQNSETKQAEKKASTTETENKHSETKRFGTAQSAGRGAEETKENTADKPEPRPAQSAEDAEAS